MRKTGLLRFHVVLPEISRGVKKFLRNNGGFDSHFPFLKPQRLSRRPRFRAFLHHVVKRRPRRIQTAVAILKQPPHAWWNARIRQRIKRAFVLHIPQIQGIRYIQIHDRFIDLQCADAVFAALPVEGDQLHGRECLASQRESRPRYREQYSGNRSSPGERNSFGGGGKVAGPGSNGTRNSRKFSEPA